MFSDMENSEMNIQIYKAQKEPLYQKVSELNLTCSFLLNDTEEYFTDKIPEKYLIEIGKEVEGLTMGILFTIGEELYGEKKFMAAKTRIHGIDLTQAFQELFNFMEESEKNKSTEKMIIEMVRDVQFTFIEYMNNLDESKYEIDPWGVLNPPSVTLDDYYEDE